MERPGGKRVAVIGATGLVGRTIADVLEERSFPVGDYVPVATETSRGMEVKAFGRTWQVRDAEGMDFEGIDCCFFTAGREVSRELVPRALECGCKVVDNTTAYRMDENVPLVVPEINGSLVTPGTGLVSSPNCTTIILVMTLFPILAKVSIKRVVVTSFQSVSGTGRDALNELQEQSRAALNGGELALGVYPKTIAFNCIPQIGELSWCGFSEEEEKVMEETKKILSSPGLQLVATAIRAPVRVGHGLSVCVELHGGLPVGEAMEAFRRSPGIEVEDPLPTPIDAAGRDAVIVGRLRQDPTRPNALVYWAVGDNLRKGAATNSVQIAELLCKP